MKQHTDNHNLQTTADFCLNPDERICLIGILTNIKHFAKIPNVIPYPNA